MGTRDQRVDAYIQSAAAFAQPILTQFREAVHENCPEVEETIRWNCPSFSYRGLLGNMAAFKAHCRIVFWKGGLIRGAQETLGRIEKLEDLPPASELAAFVKAAMQLNEQGAKPSRAAKNARLARATKATKPSAKE
jgi:hypothetical protein